VNILLYATAWGPRHGGVNAFNRNLAIALAAIPEVRGRVFCAVVAPIDEDAQSDAAMNGVELVAVKPGPTETFPTTGLKALETQLADRLGGDPVLHVGHDSLTGAAANHARAVMAGRSLVIHHMSYEAYSSVKEGPSSRTDAKVEVQRTILRKADRVAAVGPLLARLAASLTGRADVEIINPGLEIVDSQSPEDTLAVLAYGRFDKANAVIKQAPLTAASYGQACADRSIPALANPSLRIIGLDERDTTEGAVWVHPGHEGRQVRCRIATARAVPSGDDGREPPQAGESHRTTGRFTCPPG
jgi:hypothetical protein